MNDRTMGLGREVTLKEEDAYRVEYTQENGRRVTLSFYADGVHIRELVPTDGGGYYSREKFVNYDVLLFDSDARHNPETFGQDHTAR